MSLDTDAVHGDDGDLRLVQSRNVAVLGYDAVGRAHALCLRDSGVDVRVGVEGDAGREAAEAEGLRVVSPYEACEESDLIALLAPAHEHPELYGSAVAPNLVAGDAVLVGTGFGLRFGVYRPPADVDVVMVACTAPGELVRSEYDEGRGAPALVAVDQDATGQAWPLALSYATALGAARAGLIRTTVADQAESALFGGAVVGGTVAALLRSSFQVLVDAGCSTEVAFISVREALATVAREVVHGVHVDGIDLVRSGELMLRRGLVDAGVLAELTRLFERVRDESLAAEIAEARSGTDGTGDTPTGADPFSTAGDSVRAMMGWLRATGPATDA